MLIATPVLASPSVNFIGAMDLLFVLSGVESTGAGDSRSDSFKAPVDIVVGPETCLDWLESETEAIPATAGWSAIVPVMGLAVSKGRSEPGRRLVSDKLTV